MKIIVMLIGILLSAFTDLQAQSPTDSVNTKLEGLSRPQIRRQFLSLGEQSEFYELASNSRKSNTQSITSFSVGGLFVIGGFYGLIEGSDRKFGFEQLGINLLAITSLGLSIPFIIRGVKKNKDSHNSLDEAINLYNNK